MRHLLLILLVFSLGACAQKSRRGSGGDGFDDEVDSGKEDKFEEQLDHEEDKPIKEEFADVSNADLKRLSEAKKSRSEPNLLKAASEILSKNNKHLEALNTLAVFYFETKRYGMAKILLKRAMADHPNVPALQNNLGIVFLAEGDMRTALEYFRKSVTLKSSYQTGATNLGSIYLEHYDYQRSLAPLEDSYDDVASDLRRGRPEAIEIANNYGVALMGVGEKSKAEGVFERIYDSETRNPVPLLNYAILLVEVQKKKKDAIRVLSKLKFITEDVRILKQVEALEGKLSSY